MTHFEMRPASSVCSNTNPRTMDFVLSSRTKAPIQFDLQGTVLSSRTKVPIQSGLLGPVPNNKTSDPVVVPACI